MARCRRVGNAGCAVLVVVRLLIGATSADAMEPDSAEPPVKTVPSGDPDVDSVEAETRKIQQRVNESKSAINQLTQRVLDGAEPSELAVGDPRVAPGLTVAEVQYLLDGAVFVPGIDPAMLALQPGPHDLVARIEVEADEGYMSSYAFRMQASAELAPTSGAVVHAAVVLEVGDDGRPLARFDTSVDTRR